MNEFKCVECDKKAEYMLSGWSLCKKHMLRTLKENYKDWRKDET